MSKRQPIPIDARLDHGPFDIIGDVHGCAAELEALLEELGYQVEWTVEGSRRHLSLAAPSDRKTIFVGDLVDRGPASPDVLRIAMALVRDGRGHVINGNHERRLLRWLEGRSVTIANGLQQTINQLAFEDDAFLAEVNSFLGALPGHLWLDHGRLAVAHAGLTEDLVGRDSPRARTFAMFGDTTGEMDEYGFPVRRDWAARYRGATTVVYGHVAANEPIWVNNTICIDTGCVYGGRLTALRWPERELVSVPAAGAYYNASRAAG